MKKNKMDYVTTAIGILILILGLALVKTADPQGIMKALPYIFIGLGCGIFGHGMGNVISRKALKNSPEIRRQLEIDKNDERNIAIRNAAKSKAYDMMVFVFGALMLSYALMGVDLITVLLLVFAYLFVIFYGIYYRFKYEKEM
ncbi:MAG: DUF3796 domain-containing protein [Lachnoclostridium sp.]